MTVSMRILTADSLFSPAPYLPSTSPKMGRYRTGTRRMIAEPGFEDNIACSPHNFVSP